MLMNMHLETNPLYIFLIVFHIYVTTHNSMKFENIWSDSYNNYIHFEIHRSKCMCMYLAKKSVKIPKG
jgi:hypothetical protein